MFKILMIISGFAILLLAAVTVFLVRLNWNEKLYSPLLSLVLAGTVTTFITVLLMLKGEMKESTFATLVVVNSQSHLPPLLGYSISSKLNNRLSTYSTLANPNIMFEGKQMILFDSPKNDSEETVFYEELFQYKIFKEIIEMHRERETLSQDVTGVSGSISQPFKLLEIDKRQLKDFSHELSKNRFSNNKMEKILIASSFYKLPKGTDIQFKRIQSSIETGPEKHLIILTKPYYFTIEIAIEAGFGTGVNSVPQGLELSPEEVKVCKTSMFKIIMKSNFEKITAGNWRTENLKNWAEWMFGEIEKKFSDQRSN